MRFPSFIKLPKHARFNYMPRYYDERKEELAERLKSLENSQDDSTEAMKTRISRGLRTYNPNGAMLRSQLNRRSNIRVFFIIIFLIGLFLILINSYLDRILDLLY